MSAVIAAFCSAVRPGAAATMRQFSSATSTPASFSVGASTPGSRSSPETASSAQLARLDLARELAVAGDADRHLAAEDRRQRLAAAGEGDVVDLGRIDADRLGDQPGGDVVGAAGRAAGPGDRARVGLQRRDEVVHASGSRSRPARRSPPDSPVSRAIGVTMVRSTGEALVRIAPTIT